MIAIEETATVQPDGCLIVERPEFTPGARVKMILLFEAPSPAPPKPAPTGRRLRGDWGGALADLASQSTSVELQHTADEWRGADRVGQEQEMGNVDQT